VGRLLSFARGAEVWVFQKPIEAARGAEVWAVPKRSSEEVVDRQELQTKLRLRRQDVRASPAVARAAPLSREGRLDEREKAALQVGGRGWGRAVPARRVRPERRPRASSPAAGRQARELEQLRPRACSSPAPPCQDGRGPRTLVRLRPGRELCRSRSFPSWQPQVCASPPPRQERAWRREGASLRAPPRSVHGASLLDPPFAGRGRLARPRSRKSDS